jgi:ABC-2 type transport system permease protein
MQVFLAGALLQLRLLRRRPFDMIIFFTLPLQTAGFLSIFRHAGRPDLDAYALIAPALIALWQMSLMISGEIIATERDNQSLESLVAAPGSIPALLIGRISAVTLISLFGFLETAATGWLVFDVSLSIGSPGVLLLTLFTTTTATAATAILMAVLFIRSRSPRIFQNSLSYPFYLLGGVLVPVSLFPGWVQDISSLVYLSWSSDLLRDAVHHTTVTHWAERNLVVLALGAATFVIGRTLLHASLLAARKEGKIGVI